VEIFFEKSDTTKEMSTPQAVKIAYNPVFSSF